MRQSAGGVPAQPAMDLTTQATLDTLNSMGVSGAACLTPAEISALGDLSLKELKGLAKAQQLLDSSQIAGGVCGGKIF